MERTLPKPLMHPNHATADPRERAAREVLVEFRRKNNLLAVSMVGSDFLVYSASFVVGALTHSLLGKVACGLMCGVFTARLFVLAHDACHHSLTSSRPLNRLLGRLSFCPSITPYSSWELAHNSIHHVFSNWSEKDYVWAPFSKSQFESLPAFRQMLERIYRHPLGHSLYYVIEIWWKRLYFPNQSYVTDRSRYMPDSILVSISFILQSLLLIKAANPAGRGISLQLLIMILLPFVVWNCLMGFTIFLHHTHPEVPWFLDREEWKMNETQLHATVHAQFAVPFDAVFHNIYKHTAHHLDVSIPFYGLAGAQKRIEMVFPDNVIVQSLTYKQFLATTRMCKLYDYERHCWLDFNGRVTARTRLRDTSRA
jgi:omega-6 fatty acid desaturase (delta-12 desaturase)